MCGPSGIVGGIARGLGDVATFGTNELAGNPIGKLASSAISGGSTYKPQLLPQTDPTMQLAQSGGAPLLTSIALGANVDDAIAGYFGRAKGQDYNAWFNGLTPDEQAAVTGVKNQLTQIQQNTDMRNTAVQKIVNDFPNIVNMTAPQVTAAKQAAGQEFDAASKSYMDYAIGAIAAKSGGTGTVSSGANLAAADRAASELGLQKLQYQDTKGNQALDLLGQGWMQQYTEANALRTFQQKMLGQGATQGFSAAQDALKRTQDINMANAGAINQANAAKSAQDNALLGSVGQFAGMAGLLALTKGANTAAPKSPTDNMGGASDYGFSGPATPGYAANNNPSNYGITQSGYR